MLAYWWTVNVGCVELSWVDVCSNTSNTHIHGLLNAHICMWRKFHINTTSIYTHGRCVYRHNVEFIFERKLNQKKWKKKVRKWAKRYRWQYQIHYILYMGKRARERKRTLVTYCKWIDCELCMRIVWWWFFRPTFHLALASSKTIHHMTTLTVSTSIFMPRRNQYMLSIMLQISAVTSANWILFEKQMNTKFCPNSLASFACPRNRINRLFLLTFAIHFDVISPCLNLQALK